MKNIYYINLLFFCLFSCAEEQVVVQDSKDDIKVVVPEVDSVQLEIDRLKRTLITTKNAKEKLKAYGDENPETKVLMYTNYGDIKIRLYKETPLHRANFIMLSKKKYFDSTIFYRIINKFMIQGGNSDDEEITSKMASIGSYRIPNEINSKFAHVRGAVAMAVTPEEQQGEKRSSAVNFYIIQGQKLNNRYLNEIKDRGIKISKTNRAKYLQVGGAPHLDGNYTVFGEVYEGFSILSKISKVKTDEDDWPIKPVYIKSIEVIK